MFLTLAHTKLDIYKVSRSLVLECYTITKNLPLDERYGLTQQIRRAATSIHLNISEGCSRKSVLERKRFFEIARGSLIEVDTGIDIATQLCYLTGEQTLNLGETIKRTFQMISKLINASNA